MKTNKLSTERACSIQYADWNWVNFSKPDCHHIKPLNNIDKPIQILVQIAASLLEIELVRLLKSTKS